MLKVSSLWAITVFNIPSLDMGSSPACMVSGKLPNMSEHPFSHL